ncbi:MAG: hypothetical protein EU539_09355 [Promethearchaeota archaeon]|nr:MAG: hypothetical protein EU539_09355 [Candidatus Lokiarchaeota archaeon]
MKYFIPSRIPSETSSGVIVWTAKKTSIPDISGTFIAKISLVTLQAAISPEIFGSSTIGVKISRFFTNARSLPGTGITAASSISPANPALAKRLSKLFGPSLHDHPCIFTC